MEQQQAEMEQPEPPPRSTSWTAHLREARLSGSTPGLHRTPSAPAEVQDEYDPELPDLGPEEYDPEEPALALSGAHNEEYDPEEPALQRLGSSGGDGEYDPAKPATVSPPSLPTASASRSSPARARCNWMVQAAQEEYDPEKNVDLGSPRYSYDEAPAAAPLTGTPPGIRTLSPRSPEESDDADSDGEHERGRGRESERDRRHGSPQQPIAAQTGARLARYPGSGVNAFGAGSRVAGTGHRSGTGATSGDRSGIDAVVRSTAAALDALISTARLSEESWYLWGEAGEARLAMAKQFAHGLLANDLLALLRDSNVATEMRWRLTMERGTNDRAAPQQQAETPRVLPSHQQKRPPGIVSGGAPAMRATAPAMGPPGTIRKTPGPGYVCNICGVPGHWIADCPRKASGSVGSPGGRGSGNAASVRPQATVGVSRQQSRPPPDGYVCNACKVPGHWIQQCPKRLARFTEQVRQPHWWFALALSCTAC